MSIVPPPITPTPLTGFPLASSGYTNVTPLTFRDGLTYLLKLEHLACYVRDTLVPFVDESFTGLDDAWKAEVTALVDAVNAALAAQDDDIDAQLADLTTYVDNAVASIINGSVTVNDPIVRAIIADTASQVRVLLDTVYAPESVVSDVSGLTDLTETGRLSQANVNDKIAKLEGASQWLASQHGIIGDGSDEATAVNAFISAATAVGAVARFQRGTTISIGASITPPSGARIDLNGATIKLLGVGAIDLRPILILNVSDVMVWGGSVDGNQGAFATVTEHRHCIAIRGSQNIAIRDMELFNAKGDGIYIGDQTAGFSSDVYLENINCRNNYRQGMSVSHVDGLTVVGCNFTGTSGTNPQAGVDIEPNLGNIICANITFISCNFTSNGHFGMVVSFPATGATALFGNINLYGCNFSNNGVQNDTFGGGLNLRNVRTFSMNGGVILTNAGPGILIDSTAVSQDVNISAVRIAGNSREGIKVTSGVTRLSVNNCQILSNGTDAANTYSAISLLPTLASIGVRLTANNASSSSQKYGVETNANVSRLTCVGNDFAFNGTAPYNLADVIGQRLLLDVGAASQYVGTRMVFGSGFGVGNSVAFGTLGAGAKKFPVYDETGTQIGVIPIYAS